MLHFHCIHLQKNLDLETREENYDDAGLDQKFYMFMDKKLDGWIGEKKAIAEDKVQLKKELITEICAVLSFSAIQNNDKIGVIFFGNEVEKFIPPKKGKSHILRIIRELISFEPQTQGTNIGEALRYLTNAIKKKSTAFLLSDFIDDKNYESALKVANKKHDLIGLRIYDRLQEDLPKIGLVPFYDAESGSTVLVDTSSKSVRADYNLNSRKQREDLFNQFKKAGIDYANISTQDNYVRPLMNLFKKRERRR